MRETPKARTAWSDYLAMGPGRSLEALLDRYQTDPNPPTKRLKTLKEWSAAFGWQSRLTGLADQAAAEAESREVAEREAAMQTGFAVGWRRVHALKALAEKLYGELTDEADSRLWVSDSKMLGVGINAERYDFERFNASELAELRGIFSDLRTEIDASAFEARLAAVEQALEAQGKGVRR